MTKQHKGNVSQGTALEIQMIIIKLYEIATQARNDTSMRLPRRFAHRNDKEGSG